MKNSLIITACIFLFGFSSSIPAFAQGTVSTGQSQGKNAATIKDMFGKVLDAVILNISGTTISVKKNKKTYIVNTDSNTKFRRRFWGESSISELSVNDTVNVWGSWTDDAHTTMNARLIRDLSIMKKRGVFIGTVQSTNSNGFVIASQNRGNQTVTVRPSTKYSDRKGGTITFASITTGSRVRVRGMWDKTNNTITEVVEVKDFSLPMTGISPSITPLLTQ